MLETPRARRGMVTAPHHLASAAGLAVLREGGNAIEAAIAMAATLPVVYPHMTSIGGDGFWLIAAPGKDPIAIDACGAAARTATPDDYRAAGHETIPWRGPRAALTVAGTISGWGEALRLSDKFGGELPLSRLVEDAAWHAEHGFAVTRSQADLTAEKLPELKAQPGFAEHFLVRGKPPAAGQVMKLQALGETLTRLGKKGTDEFYAGKLARAIAADLADASAPVAAADLAHHRARRAKPLSLDLKSGTVFNLPPPTQGLASLMILGLVERLKLKSLEDAAALHGIVEATKQAFLVRDRIIGDPGAMADDPAAFLAKADLDRRAKRIDPDTALPWPAPIDHGDTVWLGAIDRKGLAVSMIQSIFFEFGAGVVLPETGIVWQNRGAAFTLSGAGPRVLAPGRKPFHTLNPAFARLADGGTLVYGTMGGEGQPQTQSAIYLRHVVHGVPLQEAISRPRWLLGKTWGQATMTLKLENRFDSAVVDALRAKGHDVEILPAFTPAMGHAGAVAQSADGGFEAATDPRTDGAALGW
jgi:gamma-glutamyltranspeptidase/glutathione hydrolase